MPKTKTAQIIGQAIIERESAMNNQFIRGKKSGEYPCGCETCGDDDFSPNVEAFEISGKILCDECAEEVFEYNSQFGVGA